ncbi:MAG: spore coat protein CotJB [Ruminococcaceae bacterium]|nr:spore coat protein CotJB [Oscillospiraceae bacterium]
MAEMNARQSGAQNCGAMMKKLRMLDFSIVDVGLYLDAYPDSASALEYYKKLIAERERLAAMINASGMPLTSRDGACGCSWNWTNGPWPWKPEAN